MRKTYKIRRSEVSLGMTLIELMVVTSIMLILVVMSVPVFKPMLESRKQADGAQTLSIYLNVARIRATETGRPCGVMFERYTDNNYQEDGETVFPNNDTCLVVRQVEVPPPYCGSLEDIRVAVYRNGNIAFFAWRDAEFDNNGNVLEQAHWRETSNEDAFWNAMVGVGDKIQFDNQGLYFTLNSATASSGSATLTVGAGPGILTNERRYRVNEVYIYKDRQGTEYLAAYAPVPFKVLRAPKPTLTAPIGFPTGIVVDLEYSGINNGDYIMTGNGDAAPLTRGSDFRPAGPSTQEPVYVMFSDRKSVV